MRFRRLLRDWMALKRTSPVVPWNGDTLDQVKQINRTLEAGRVNTARIVDRMPALQAEMEEAWRLK